MNCGAFLLSRRASARLFHTINAVRFSPSHTSSNKISWLVAKGEEVACYDPIYTAKAQNLTIFDDDSEISQDDEGTEMIVETCEDGFISFITHPEKTQPDELIGILSADEEEHEIITNLLNEKPTLTIEQALSSLSSLSSLSHEGPIQWEAFLHNTSPPP